MWLQTLKMNYKYILKTLAQPDSRFTKRVSILLTQKKSGWYKDWRKLFYEFNEEWVDPMNQPDLWGRGCEKIVGRIRDKFQGLWWDRAATSQFHQIYFNLGRNGLQSGYINDNNKRRMISIIFRARGALLPLNFRVDRGENSYICSLCNSGEVEDTYHFIGRCKALSEFRVKWFGCSAMTNEMVHEYLNGENWKCLIGFLTSAQKYRDFLVREFNF